MNDFPLDTPAQNRTGDSRVMRWLMMPISMLEIAKATAYALLKLGLILLAVAVLVSGFLAVMPLVWVVRRMQASPTDS